VIWLRLVRFYESCWKWLEVVLIRVSVSSWGWLVFMSRFVMLLMSMLLVVMLCIFIMGWVWCIVISVDSVYEGLLCVVMMVFVLFMRLSSFWGGRGACSLIWSVALCWWVSSSSVRFGLDVFWF